MPGLLRKPKWEGEIDDSSNAHDRSRSCIILGGRDYPQQILGIQNTDSGKTLPERRRPAGHESNYDRLLINKIYSNLSVFHTLVLYLYDTQQTLSCLPTNASPSIAPMLIDPFCPLPYRNATTVRSIRVKAYGLSVDRMHR